MRVEDGYAVLFPGQGVSVARSRPEVERVLPELLARARELIGEDCFARAGESTRFAQPAIFLSSLAAYGRLEGGHEAVAFAGHSLGELSALAAAGALRREDALELVVLRGRLMEESGRSSGDGTMLALLRGTPALAAEVAEEAGVWVANDNAPGQIVLAGAREALRQAAEIGRAKGMRTMSLDVTGAFHTPWMAAAQGPFREALAAVEVARGGHRLLGPDRGPFTDVREELAAALTGPVRWRETMIAIAARGARTFIDVGPEQVLAKLVTRNVEGADAIALETLEEEAAA